MDELLRDPASHGELQSYKAPSPLPDDGMKGSRALGMLQGSIQSDLNDIREKRGQMSQDEARSVMMKMMMLRKLEQQQHQSSSSSGEESSNTGGPDAPASDHVATPADSVGCTAVTVLITPDKFIAANAGDSRAVLCRDGKAVALTQDHKPNDEGELERIKKAGGTVEESQGGARTHYRVNGNLNLSRAIGDLEYKRKVALEHSEHMITSTPDVFQIDRSPLDEFIVIACDGVWDVLSNEDCVELIRSKLAEGKALRDIAEDIADECLTPDPKATQGIGADNITCLIVDLRTNK